MFKKRINFDSCMPSFSWLLIFEVSSKSMSSAATVQIGSMILLVCFFNIYIYIYIYIYLIHLTA
jgi:hypothetical protein